MYWTLFLTFIKIGAFTIGGGYAMLPLIQQEVVGYKLKKITGGIICALGTILPSFLIILAIALFFTQIQDNIWIEKAFKGLRPAVVALIAVPCLTTARSIKLSHKAFIIPITAALLIWLGGLSPVWIILTAIVGGIIYGLKIKK